MSDYRADETEKSSGKSVADKKEATGPTSWFKMVPEFLDCQRTDLSPLAKLLLMVLDCHCGKEKPFCWASLKTLGKWIDRHEKNVRAELARLEERGWVKREFGPQGELLGIIMLRRVDPDRPAADSPDRLTEARAKLRTKRGVDAPEPQPNEIVHPSEGAEQNRSPEPMGRTKTFTPAEQDRSAQPNENVRLGRTKSFTEIETAERAPFETAVCEIARSPSPLKTHTRESRSGGGKEPAWMSKNSSSWTTSQRNRVKASLTLDDVVARAKRLLEPPVRNEWHGRFEDGSKEFVRAVRWFHRDHRASDPRHASQAGLTPWLCERAYGRLVQEIQIGAVDVGQFETALRRNRAEHADPETPNQGIRFLQILEEIVPTFSFAEMIEDRDWRAHRAKREAIRDRATPLT